MSTPDGVDGNGRGQEDVGVTRNERLASVALDLTPGVGQIKSLWQLCSGTDVITGEPVNRWMELAGLIPWVKAARGGGKLLKVLKSAAPEVAQKAVTKAEMRTLIESVKPPKPSTMAKYPAERQQRILKDFEKKKADLLRAVERGDVGTLKDVRSGLTRDYRANLQERADRLFRNNPEAMRNFQERLSKSDIDHMLDLQLGGADALSNMRALDSVVNRSMGPQLRNALKKLESQALHGFGGDDLQAVQKALSLKDAAKLTAQERHVLEARSVFDLDAKKLGLTQDAASELATKRAQTEATFAMELVELEEMEELAKMAVKVKELEQQEEEEAAAAAEAVEREEVEEQQQQEQEQQQEEQAHQHEEAVLQDLQRQLSEANAEVAEWTAAVKDAEQAAAKDASDADQLEQAAAQEQTRIGELEAHIAQLKEHDDEANQLLATMRARKEGHMSAARQKRASAKQRTAAPAAQLQAAQNRVSGLSSSVETLKRSADQHKQAADRAKSRKK